MAGSGKYRVAVPPLPDFVMVAGDLVPKAEYLAAREALWQQRALEQESSAAAAANKANGVFSPNYYDAALAA